MSHLRSILFGAAALLGTACQVEYHPYDTRVQGATQVNALQIARIEQATAGRRTIRFAVISDTQRWYDETRDAVEALNARDDLDFVLHAGDISDFGMRAEFERQRDILQRLRVPYVVLLGNHDCLASGEEVYERIFGAFNFAFTAGAVRFVCLNTNALEFDHSAAVPDFGFMRSAVKEFPEEACRSVVVMHAAPFTEQFDDNVADVFQHYVRQLPGLQCCIHGHGHAYRVADLFDDGVIYYECENIQKRSYLLFTIDDNGYSHERICF